MILLTLISALKYVIGLMLVMLGILPIESVSPAGNEPLGAVRTIIETPPVRMTRIAAPDNAFVMAQKRPAGMPVAIPARQDYPLEKSCCQPDMGIPVQFSSLGISDLDFMVTVENEKQWIMKLENKKKEQDKEIVYIFTSNR